MTKFQDKVVLITGGGGGIGKAAARRFLEEGASVVLNSRRQEVLDRAKDELAAYGERVGLVAADASNRPAGQELVDQAVDAFGRVDVVVNSTGIFRVVPFLDQTEEHVEEALDSILRPTYYVTQAAVRQMVDRGEGGAVVTSARCGPSTRSPRPRLVPIRRLRRAATRSRRTSRSSSPRTRSA